LSIASQGECVILRRP